MTKTEMRASMAQSLRGLPPPRNADATHADWCRMVFTVTGSYQLVNEGFPSHGRHSTP